MKQRPIDLEAGLAAKLKQARDEPLSKKEQAAAKAYDKWIVIEVANKFLREVPKGVYAELSGRQYKILDEQADRYDLPIGKAIIDLKAVLTRFHDILADWGPIAERDKELDAEKTRQSIERLKKQNQLADLNIMERERKFITRSEVQQSLSWLANRLKTISERLGKRFGPDSQKLLNEGIQQIEDDLIKDLTA